MKFTTQRGLIALLALGSFILVWPGVLRNRTDVSNSTVHALAGSLVQAGAQNNVFVFQPTPFFRSSGAPQTQAVSFSVLPPVHGPFAFVVENGSSSGANRVSSARIRLNGSEIFGPSDFNQHVSRLERSVTLNANNSLQVELRGAPGGTLTISISGKINADAELAQASGAFNSSGGALSLPNLAELNIPPDTVTNAEISLTAIDSDSMDYFTSSEPSFTKIEAPQFRIKSSVPLSGPVSLQVNIAGLSGVIPPDKELVFAALVRGASDEGEEIDDVIMIPAAACGEQDAFCVRLLPNWFVKVNPLDPLDPVSTVSLGLRPRTSQSLHLWELDSVAPAANHVQVSQNDTLTFSGNLRLQKNFTFFPGSPLQSIFIRSHFFRDDGDPHGGLDLPTPTGTPVFGVLDGNAVFAGRAIPKPNDPGTECDNPDGTTRRIFGSYGNHIRLQHDGKFQTYYAHLQRFNLGIGDPMTPGAPIGFSGDTGEACGPHLHFETRFDGQQIDPEPLLLNNMAMYVSDPAHPVKLMFFLDKTLLGAPQQMTSVNHSFSQSVSFSSLQPGHTYTLRLKLESDRLGAHTLREWKVEVLAGFTLSVTKSGSGGGIVTSSPTGIDCGPVCAASFASGTNVVLTATPASGSQFIGWGGDCQGSGASATVTINADKTCSATFVTATGSISGSVARLLRFCEPRECRTDACCLRPAPNSLIRIWIDNGDGVFSLDSDERIEVAVDGNSNFTLGNLQAGSYWILTGGCDGTTCQVNIPTLLILSPGQQITGVKYVFGAG